MDIVDILKILGRAGVARSIIGVRTCLFRAAERDQFLVDDLQVAHVIRGIARSVGKMTMLCVHFTAVVRVRVRIMVIMLRLGQCLKSSSVVILDMDSSSDGILFALRVGRMHGDHFLNSEGELPLKTRKFD